MSNSICRFKYLTRHTLKCLGLNKAGIDSAFFVVSGRTKDWRTPKHSVRRCTSLCELRAAFRELSADDTLTWLCVDVWWPGDTAPVRDWAVLATEEKT